MQKLQDKNYLRVPKAPKPVFFGMFDKHDDTLLSDNTFFKLDGWDALPLDSSKVI